MDSLALVTTISSRAGSSSLQNLRVSRPIVKVEVFSQLLIMLRGKAQTVKNFAIRWDSFVKNAFLKSPLLTNFTGQGAADHGIHIRM